MKQLIRSKKIYTKTGQALAELAIFASILLFVLSLLVQYGLSFNHQQEERMTAFRKALSMAPILGANGVASHYVRVEDRAVPNIQDETNVSEHYPFGSSASVLISSQLAGDRSPGDTNHLPRSYVQINGEMIGKDGNDFLTTAGWGSKVFTSAATIKIKKAKDAGFGGMSYEWQDLVLGWDEHGIVCTPGYVCQTWERLTTKPEIKGLWADVDNDGIEEQITATQEANGQYYNPNYGNCPDGAGICVHKYISRIEYIDSNGGDVDWADENQGYRPDYTKTVSVDASLTRLENSTASPDAIVTTDKVTVQEQIDRLFKAQGLSPSDEQLNFINTTSRETIWETPNE